MTFTRAGTAAIYSSLLFSLLTSITTASCLGTCHRGYSACLSQCDIAVPKAGCKSKCRQHYQKFVLTCAPGVSPAGQAQPICTAGKCDVKKGRAVRRKIRISGVESASGDQTQDNAQCKADCYAWTEQCNLFCGYSQNPTTTCIGQGQVIGQSCFGNCDIFYDECECVACQSNQSCLDKTCIPFRNDCYSYCPTNGDNIPGDDCTVCLSYYDNCALKCDDAFPTPAPTPTPPLVPCQPVDMSSYQGITTFSVELGATSGTFGIWYTMLDLPDSLDITYEGVNIFSTGGYVSGSDAQDVRFGPGSATIVEVTVDGRDSGTAWYVTVSCPTS